MKNSILIMHKKAFIKDKNVIELVGMNPLS